MKFGTFRQAVLGAAAVAMTFGAPVAAEDVDKIHFLIPGGAGGGWDGTARGTGEALTKSGLVGSATYENMSGGGGGKAIAHLIETADKQHGAHFEIDIAAPPMRHHTGNGGRDDLPGLRSHGYGRGNTDEEKQRRQQKTAADAKNSR